MASNQQKNNNSSSEINLHADVRVIQEHIRRRVHKSTAINRNYPLLQRGKETILRNYNGIKSIIQRNYRRFSY